MLEHNLNDTIAAISTAQGQGGIGIVRLSGPKAVKIASRLFVGRGNKKLKKIKSHSMHYGFIVDDGKIVDEVILSAMLKPRSYTRQDVVEINCHGGLFCLSRILDLTIQSGARLAQPGEFTKRAFLNGRIDLAQAEAVMDIICAKTDSALKISLGQLSGALSKEINKLRKDLINVLTVLEANIDFPDDTGAYDLSSISKKIASLSFDLSKLLEGSSSGRILREGLLTVICGKPNVGKSSLLNALLKKERSIVTPFAGTTRDAIEELIDIKGIPVRITDTAGILKPRNLIEQKAVVYSRRYIKSADLLIVMFDASKKLDNQDKKIIAETAGKNVIAVINKIDLPNRIEKKRIEENFASVLEICANTGKYIEGLEQAIQAAVFKSNRQGESPAVSNLRHIEALRSAKRLVLRAGSDWNKRMAPEFVSQSLKDACSYLDKILGKSFSEDLLDRIFSDFCIGK